MTPVSSVRLATCALAATIAGTAAATLPTVARADDLPASAAAVSPVDAAAALVEEASAAAAAGDVVADPLGGSTGAEDDADAVEGLPGPLTASGATADPTAGSNPSLESSPAPDPSPESADTTPDRADISGSIAIEEPSAVEPFPTGARTAPVNVNVSVRIGSPGDDGPVTQVNAAGTTGLSPPSAAAPVEERSVTTGTPTEVARGEEAVSPAPKPASGSPSVAEGTPGTWSWQWNCVSVPDLPAISRTGSDAGSLPVNWTWIWNCGENAKQYQDETPTQYQPSNVNVSVRISSPGRNGPVNQANVAAAVVAGAASSAVAPIPPTAPTGGVGQGPFRVLPVANGIVDAVLPDAAWVAVTAPTLGAVTAVVETDGSSLAEITLGPVERPHVLPPLTEQATVAGTSVVVRLPALQPPIRPATFDATVTLESRETISGGVAVNPAAGTGGHRESVVSVVSHASKKPAPRWKAPKPQPVPEAVPSGASATPAAGGGSSGGGIPIFLALPFLAAMLDLARRVALDRAALPSGFRSRMPENPG